MRRITKRRGVADFRAGLPAAVAGSLAATLIAAPAHAGEVDNSRALDRAPAPLFGQPAALHVSMAKIAVSAAVRALAEAPSDYVVAPGDTVWAIADRFGVKVSDVLAWNALGPSATIFPGQTLSLRGVSAPATAPAPAPAPSPPAPSSATHTVAAGDTLFAIAQKHGVSLRALLAANALAETTVIHPGQTITIPGSRASASQPAPAAAPAEEPAGTTASSYTISQGDTLSSIAHHHGVTLKALFAANDLGPGSIIYPGQTVSIPATAPAPAQSDASARHNLDAEQIANVKLIIQTGRELGVPDRGIAIALSAAMVESWIRNLDWGDRDSLGLFQQRPSTGWGSPDEIRDPVRATRAFFGGTHNPNGSDTRGLLDVRGWESMGFSEAAQAVQISAYPERYGEWESAAYGWLATWG